MKENKSTIWKIISLILAIALVAVSALYANTVKGIRNAGNQAEESVAEEETATAANLSLWNDSAPAKKQLLDYVKAVTTEGSPDFIPEEDRIAVFDLDGTLACETDPCYFDHCIYYYRVMEDPDYKDQAKQIKSILLSTIRNSIFPANTTGLLADTWSLK